MLFIFSGNVYRWKEERKPGDEDSNCNSHLSFSILLCVCVSLQIFKKIPQDLSFLFPAMTCRVFKIFSHEQFLLLIPHMLILTRKKNNLWNSCKDIYTNRTLLLQMQCSTCGDKEIEALLLNF